MTNSHLEAFSALFKRIFKGNTEATALAFSLLSLAHTWDDLVDGDKLVPTSAIDSAFLTAAVDLTLNPIWDQALAANLLNVYLRWNDANTIESNPSSSGDALTQAWMLRAGLYDLFVLIAAKVHGVTWAKSISLTVREAYGETLADYKKEIRNA